MCYGTSTADPTARALLIWNHQYIKESMQVKSMFSSIVQVPNGCTAIV